MLTQAGGDATEAGGFIDRLQANASKLVRIHPVDAPAGDDPRLSLRRIEVKTARNDLAGIDGELDKLPAPKHALLPTQLDARNSQRPQGRARRRRKLAADAARCARLAVSDK